jgi:hypothetical protein
MEIEKGAEYQPYQLNPEQVEKADKPYVEVLDQRYCVPLDKAFEIGLAQAEVPSSGKCLKGAKPLRINIYLKATDLVTRYTLFLGRKSVDH